MSPRHVQPIEPSPPHKYLARIASMHAERERSAIVQQGRRRPLLVEQMEVQSSALPWRSLVPLSKHRVLRRVSRTRHRPLLRTLPRPRPRPPRPPMVCLPEQVARLATQLARPPRLPAPHLPEHIVCPLAHFSHSMPPILFTPGVAHCRVTFVTHPTSPSHHTLFKNALVY